MAEKPTTVEQYMVTLSDEVATVVRELRAIIGTVIQDAEDCISYAIPAIKVNGKILLYYSGWKNHVSMYPIPPGTAAFEHRIAPYVAGKGTLKFPLSQPLPHELVAEVAATHLTRLRAAEAERLSRKKTATKAK